MFGRALGIIRRTKSLDDLPNGIPLRKQPEIPKGGKISNSKQSPSSTLDKNPTDHAGGLEVNLEWKQSWESETIVADRRNSLGSLGSSRYHDPSKAVDVPPNGFVSERRPINLRTIRNTWNTFKIQHPKAVKLAKWTAWLLGAAATTGGSVVLSEEIRKLYRKADLNVTIEQLKDKIEVVTNEFERLLNASMNEFERKPSQAYLTRILNLYIELKEAIPLISFSILNRYRLSGKKTNSFLNAMKLLWANILMISNLVSPISMILAQSPT